MYRSNAPHILAVVQVQAWGRQFAVDTVGATAARHFQVRSSSPAVLGRRSLEAGVAAAQAQVNREKREKQRENQRECGSLRKKIETRHEQRENGYV